MLGPEARWRTGRRPAGGRPSCRGCGCSRSAAEGEWTVSELVQVMGQSQPRISRHLKVLAEAGLLERFREGSWVFYRRAQSGDGARLARLLGRLLPDDDPLLMLDQRRLAGGAGCAPRAGRALLRRPCRGLGQRARPRRRRRRRRGGAGAICSATSGRRACSTSAPAPAASCRCWRRMSASGSGIDLSHDMLAVARANLDRRAARNCQVRQGDMYQLPLPDGSVRRGDAASGAAFRRRSPARYWPRRGACWRPGGRLVVVDLPRHDAGMAARPRSSIAGSASPTSEMARWFAASWASAGSRRSRCAGRARCR